MQTILQIFFFGLVFSLFTSAVICRKALTADANRARTTRLACSAGAIAPIGS
jgi:hypothetical protein